MQWADLQLSTYDSASGRDTSGKGDIFPCGNNDVLGHEGFRSHDALPDVPLGTLTDLYAKLVLPRVQVTLQSERKRNPTAGQL